jgi:hypothetical protein
MGGDSRGSPHLLNGVVRFVALDPEPSAALFRF